MTAERIAADLEQFVRDQFAPAGRGAELRTIDLWEEGIVDSAGAIELIVHLEAAHRITIPADALASDGFRTIDGIARVVAALITGEP